VWLVSSCTEVDREGLEMVSGVFIKFKHYSSQLLLGDSTLSTIKNPMLYGNCCAMYTTN